jgi:hypothetical protein
MDAAWPPANGEAIHTSTFLGHPVGCAMALAQIKEIKARKLVQRSAELGKLLLASLSTLDQRGLILGVAAHCRPPAGLKCACQRRPLTRAVPSVIVKHCFGSVSFSCPREHSNVIGFTRGDHCGPPARSAVDALGWAEAAAMMNIGNRLAGARSVRAAARRTAGHAMVKCLSA